MSLTWSGRPPAPRQEVGGLVVRPQWRVPDLEESRAPRWFGVAAIVTAMLAASIVTTAAIKALDLGLLTWAGTWP